jgi:uncharacterized membrane protein
MYETRKRTVVKSILWRCIATLNAIIVTYVFTGKVTAALTIGITANISGAIFYYIHERIWNKIKWQKQ